LNSKVESFIVFEINVAVWAIGEYSNLQQCWEKNES
jgi:hypothetical protein